MENEKNTKKRLCGTSAECPSIQDFGEYVPNELDMSYKSVFFRRGMEKVIRDSVIGGERSSLWNDGWKFTETDDLTADLSGADDSAWDSITLPHDFQILRHGSDVTLGALTEDRKGWYKKRFTLPESVKGKRVSVRFDGIYQASAVYVNGVPLPEFDIDSPTPSPYSGTHYYGYKTFEADITDYISFGHENTIAVSVEDFHGSSRWYTGGGINRNVWLTVTDKVHINLFGQYVHYKLDISYSSAKVTVETEIKNDSDTAAEVLLRYSVTNRDEKVLPDMQSDKYTVTAGETKTISQTFTVGSPRLWDLSNDEGGNLYHIYTEVISDDEIRDTYISEFGFRDIRWSEDTGVYLNGRHIDIRGVCQHENYGALGSANNAAALERQLAILKKMGVNAVRTAHNICTPELITICSRLGILVFEECYDAWDDNKDGEYSLGGQGLFEKSCESDIRSMVRRDRNAPCVFVWSIGNEIIQTVWGSMDNVRGMISNMLDYICEEDPSGGRFITLAQMQWTTEFSREVSVFICEYLKEHYTDCGVMGQNYREYYMQLTREQYPGYRMLGTELSSAMRTRGVYHEGKYVYMHEDRQLSSLDNCGTAYALTAEEMYMFDKNRPWYAGGFIWSGFDYIGEPTPYDTKNSYFGIIDTAGLPKDIYYFYRSVWNKDEDTLHIFPNWDKNDGDTVEIKAYSNAEGAELLFVPYDSRYETRFMRDSSDINKNAFTESWNDSNRPEYAEKLHFSFNLEYHPGTIYVSAVYPDGHRIYTSVSTPGNAEKLTLKSNRNALTADGCDIAAVEITAVDSDGIPVLQCSDRVKVEVSGAGVLVGTDTGNPLDFDSYRSETKRLFNGKAVAYIRSNGEVGDIRVTVSAVTTEKAALTITAISSDSKPLFPAKDYTDTSIPPGDTIYARKLEITPAEGSCAVLTAERPTAVFNFRLLPENANVGGEPQFSVIGADGYVRVNNAAIDVNYEEKTLTVTGLKPGSFRIYGTYKNGGKYPQLLSVYNMTNESAVSDDISLGNDAYNDISAVALDPSSRNSSYEIDYNDGVIKNINRPNDTLIYKDVSFGTDYSRRFIINCVNISKDTAASIGIYSDDTLLAVVTIPAGEADTYSPDALKEHTFPCIGITGTHDITLKNLDNRPNLYVRSFRFTSSVSDPYGAYAWIDASKADCCAAAQVAPTVTLIPDGDGECEAMDVADNASIYYTGIDFGDKGSDEITIRMQMTDDSSRISVKLGNGAEMNIDWTSMPEYKSGCMAEYTAKLDKTYTGMQDLTFVAYPGTHTYIDRFKFNEK